MTERDLYYYVKLTRRLAEREQKHGFAYVTQTEARYLRRNNLYQPGHTRFRYSVPGENLSDAAQGHVSDES
jgi:hypothetical protein